MTTFVNSKGEKIDAASIFSEADLKRHAVLQNAIEQQGLEIDITNLTYIIQETSKQKFYTLDLKEYMPILVGNGAYNKTLTKFREFANGGDFEDGIVGVAREARLEETHVSADALTVGITNWAKENVWNVFDIQYASKSGVWDIVEAKERSRKKNWDLGIQRLMFLGTKDGGQTGLLNDANIMVNQTVLTAPLATMTDGQFQTFCAGLIGAYRARSNYTESPNRFVIPDTEYTALATATSLVMPTISRLEYMEKTFRLAANRPDFRILPCVYCQAAQSDGALTADRYALYNSDVDTMQFNIPVDYTPTQINTLEGFNFRNVAFGQFAEPMILRPRELLYLEVAGS